VNTECLKCGFIATGNPPTLACPKCGAIYAKLHSLAAAGRLIRPVSLEQLEMAETEREAIRQRERERMAAQEAIRQRELERIAEQEAEQKRRQKEAIAAARESGDWSGMPAAVVASEKLRLTLTTTQHVPGRETLSIIGIVSAECVYGMNFFKDVLADVRDIVGGRSATAQKVLHDARVAALHDLREEAFQMGAHAVVAISFEFNEMSGGMRMLFVTATGTAVKLSPEPASR